MHMGCFTAGDARDYSLQANSQLTTAEELIVAYSGGFPLRLN
jgi:hypothetical protein